MVKDAARLCVINGLSELKNVVGNLDNIKFVSFRLCELWFIFYCHAKVINGASDFLVEVFGEKENMPEYQLEQVAWL
jgi:hypothetical protein